MRHSLIAIAALAVLSLTATGCKKKAKSQSTPSPAPVEAAPAAKREADPEGAEAMRTIYGRLSFEAAHRPSGTAKVEDVLAALAKAGVDVTEVKQYVGLTAAASYCAGGRTADGLGVAICEYESPAAAAAGRDHVEKTFANIPGRQIAIHGATTLTTTAVEGKDLAAIRAKAEQTFAAM